MKLRLTLLAAAAAAGLWSTAPMAQHTSNPTGSYMDSVPYGTWTGGPTHSPNTVYVYPAGTSSNVVHPSNVYPSHVYQSNMYRSGTNNATYIDSVPYGTWTGGPTQSPNTAYMYPSGTNYVAPGDRAVIYEPTVSRRGMTYGYGPTHSPNPNKAQNSDMRTQIGSDTMYVYPSGTAYVVPNDRTVIYEPTVSRRGMSYGPTHTPNPNKVQNNGVPTQY